MFPVQLPPWMPEEVARNMLNIFQTKICHEVTAMLSDEPKPRTSISSVQSVGSLTAPSVVRNSSVTSGGHITLHQKLFGLLDPQLLKMTPFSTLLVQQ
jgi:hypothetical protein